MGVCIFLRSNCLLRLVWNTPLSSPAFASSQCVHSHVLTPVTKILVPSCEFWKQSLVLFLVIYLGIFWICFLTEWWVKYLQVNTLTEVKVLLHYHQRKSEFIFNDRNDPLFSTTHRILEMVEIWRRDRVRTLSEGEAGWGWHLLKPVRQV